jgi:anti-sigma B factor antagonist
LLTIRKKLIDPDIALLEISGRITLGRECQQVEWQVEDLLREKQTKVVLDLSGVNQIDSTGVGILVLCSGKMQKSGGELRIAGAAGMVIEVLRLAKVDHIIQFFQTTEAAAESFSHPTHPGPPN